MHTLIGIPTLNGPDRLDRCLKSIREHTDLTNVTLLVSDDASSPENLLSNKNVITVNGGVPMLMTGERLGVPKQWNRLVRHMQADVCVLLNDDMEVAQDWLDVILFTLERNPWIGMLGLRSETGVTRGNAVPRARVDYNEAAIQTGGGSLVSSGGSCFAFRRAEWEAVGGFDERYFCFYEEVDFGVSLSKKLGLMSAIASYPVLYHMGGATIAENANASAVIVDSRRKFWEKWNQTMDQLRAEATARFRERAPVLVEWNSTWKYGRLP